MFGFGCWKLSQTGADDEPVPSIRIPYFGVDQRFHGERDAEDRSQAGRLFTTIETLARHDDSTTDDMPVDLYCDAANDRGLRFWRRRGFIAIDEFQRGDHHYVYMLKR